MQMTRRMAMAGGAAALVSGCVGSPAVTPARASQTTLPTVPNAGWDAWVANFRPRAVAAGIDPGVVSRAFAGAGYIPGVIERDRNQTEFSRTLEDYLQIAAGEKKVAQGRAAFARQRGTLNAIAQRYGVEANVVAAIWGLESNYGDRRGNIPIVSSTSTLAYDGRRGQFFEKQLIAALRILQRGDTTPERMVGSWAGAMGHTQFIPTSYQSLAVDFNGDGRRDIWSDDPTDALASTANYLAKNGWQTGQPWGYEITPSRQGSGGRVIQPQAGGPRFRVFRNFDVIKRYNNSDSYAIGVGHLSDRIAGGGPIQSSFPPDRNGLTKDQRLAIQSRLNAAGFDAGEPDGVIGSGTRRAITAYQQSNGLPATGEPSLDLLRRLGG